MEGHFGKNFCEGFVYICGMRVFGFSSLLCESLKLVLGKALEREFSSAHRRGSVELGTSANGVGHGGGLG